MKKIIAAFLTALFIIAQASTAFAAGGYTETFDGSAGSDLLSEGWTLSGGEAGSTVKRQEDIKAASSGNMCLNLVGKSSGYSDMTVTKTLSNPVVPLANGKLNISFRTLIVRANNSDEAAYGCGMIFGEGNNAVFTLAVTNKGNRDVRLLNENTYNGDNPAFFNNNSLLGASAWSPFSSWMYFRFECDFTTNTLDCYVGNGSPIAENATPAISNVSFVTKNNPYPTKIDTIKVLGGRFMKNVDLWVDDISIQPVSVPAPAEYAIADNSAKYILGTNDVTVTADITKGEGSAVIVAVAYNNNNQIIGTDTEFAFNGESYSKMFSVGNETVSDVKIYIWQSFGNCKPICVSPAVLDLET